MVVICRPRPALAEPRLVWVILIDDENCATTRLTLDLGKYIYRQISVYSGLIILVISCSLGQKVYIILYPKKERCGKQARILKRCRKEKIHFFLSRSKKYGVGWVKERRARSKVEGKRRREREKKARFAQNWKNRFSDQNGYRFHIWKHRQNYASGQTKPA